VDSLNKKNSGKLGQAKNKLASFIVLKKNKMLKKTSLKNNQEQIELDKKLIYSLSKSKIPSFKQIKYIKKFLSSKELKIIKVCSIILILSLGFLVWHYYRTHIQVVPKIGGEYTEGLVGSIKYINPLYSSAGDADNDISALIYSSILQRGKNGELINDLATEYKIYEDGKIYEFKIRTDVKWHNNSDLTVDDIVFTFNAIKDIQYKSPLKTSFTGVTITKINEDTIRFILVEPYAAFFELLTFGILPQELWLQIPPEGANLAELNLKPIGSGPYKFKSLIKDKAGNIKIYNLTLNEEYYGQPAFVKNLSFKFFINFEEAIGALNENSIEGLSYLPHYLKDELIARDSLSFHEINLGQITAIFFNQKNNKALESKELRQTLALAIDKNKIIDEIFNQSAVLVDGPILANNFSYNKDIKKYRYNIEEASKLLSEAELSRIEVTEEEVIEAEKNLEAEDEDARKEAAVKINLGVGSWLAKKSGDQNEFIIINLTTVETDDNKKVVELIKKSWEELGVKTNIHIVAANQIQSEVIKPRNFEALFYGQIVGNDPDSYAFWHSSQIGESGLNITDYANKEVDTLLEDARLTNNQEDRIAKYKKFQEILAEEVPAIFMYSPIYTYVQSKKIKGFDINNILIPRDRLANISEWYIETGKKIIWRNK